MNDQDTVIGTSTTDSAEQIAHAMGKKTEPVTKVTPAEGEEPAERVEASGASEKSEDERAASLKSEKPGKDGFQKRIDKLTKDRADAKKERDYWRDLAMKNDQKPPEQSKAPEKKETKPTDGKPNKDDFPTHEDYLEALTDWKADQKIDEKLASRDAKAKQDNLRAEMEKSKKAHLDRVDAFKKTHEDFNDVLQDIADFRLSSSLERALLESDNGPELMYEFAKNPAELERINALDPAAQARALGRFESSFQKASQAKEKEDAKEVEAKAETIEAKPKPKISKAPPPIKPVGSKAGNPKTIWDEDMSVEDWISLRNKQKGV